MIENRALLSQGGCSRNLFYEAFEASPAWMIHDAARGLSETLPRPSSGRGAS